MWGDRALALIKNLERCQDTMPPFEVSLHLLLSLLF